MSWMRARCGRSPPTGRQEITFDLERGKTLMVRYLAMSEPHEDGTRTVFFELNARPRSVRVPDHREGRSKR